jgi:imidazolonepropionase-like amidohydrolase
VLLARAVSAATGAGFSVDDRRRLLQAKARAHLQAYQIGAAMDAVRAAAAIARASADRTALTEVALVLEGFADVAQQAEVLALCEEAMDLLPDDAVLLRARLLADMAVQAQLVEASVPARELSERALAVAEGLGEPGVLTTALHARQLARSGPDGVQERLALGDRLLEIGAGIADYDEALWGRLWRFDALLQLGRVDEAEAEVGPMAALAERTRRPLARWHIVRSTAAIAFGRGRFTEAAELAEQARGQARRAGHAGGIASAELALILIGSQTGAEFPADLYSGTRATWQMIAGLPVLMGVRQLTLGDEDGARRSYSSFPTLDQVPPFVHLPMLQGKVELAAGLGDLAGARDAYQSLQPYADLFVCGGVGALTIHGSVQSWLGVAAGAIGRGDDAVRRLHAGVAANERAGLRPFVAHSRLQLARVLARRGRAGDTEEAAALADVVGALSARSDAEARTSMAEAARVALAGGVTTVRDLGDRGYLSLGLRGVAGLPTIVAAGPPITTPSGHCHYLGGETQPGQAVVRRAVREHVEHGVDIIKIMASGGTLTPGTRQECAQFTPDDLHAVIDEAHRYGLPVTAHAHGTTAVADAVAAGVDGMEHVSFWSADGVDAPADLIHEIADRRIVVGATMGLRPAAGMTPPPQVVARLPKIIENFRVLVEAGAPLVAGTDAGIGPLKPHDVARYAIPQLIGLRFSRAEALRTLTSVAAGVCGLAHRKGRLAAGFDADLLAIDGDPLTDADAIHRIRAVYAAGVPVA